MKWFIIIVVLLSDFILLAALGFLFYEEPKLAIVLVFPVYFVWKSTGGLSNWKFSTIRKFLRNWKIIFDSGENNV